MFFMIIHVNVHISTVEREGEIVKQWKILGHSCEHGDEEGNESLRKRIVGRAFSCSSSSRSRGCERFQACIPFHLRI